MPPPFDAAFRCRVKYTSLAAYPTARLDLWEPWGAIPRATRPFRCLEYFSQSRDPPETRLLSMEIEE
jgi:hypothetical protein